MISLLARGPTAVLIQIADVAVAGFASMRGFSTSSKGQWGDALTEA